MIHPRGERAGILNIVLFTGSSRATVLVGDRGILERNRQRRGDQGRSFEWVIAEVRLCRDRVYG